jgi:metal-responsive CopG/Arc/MetJ family transcriptional regulator
MKIAISVPNELFEAGKHLARELGLSRSQLYGEALTQYLSAKRGAEITARLNAIYTANSGDLDLALSRAQAHTLPDEAW